MTDNGHIAVTFGAAVKVPLPDGTKRVRVQNLGPNILYYGSTSAKAASTDGLQIAITNGTVDIDVGGHELWVRTVVADQTSPADTRWYVIG